MVIGVVEMSKFTEEYPLNVDWPTVIYSFFFSYSIPPIRVVHMSLSSFRILNYRVFYEVSCMDIVTCISNLSNCITVCNRYTFIYIFCIVQNCNLVILVEFHSFLVLCSSHTRSWHYHIFFIQTNSVKQAVLMVIFSHSLPVFCHSSLSNIGHPYKAVMSSLLASAPLFW